MRCQLGCQEDSGRTVSSTDDTDGSSFAECESKGSCSDKGNEDTQLSSSTKKECNRVCQKRTEVCHCTDTQEDDRWEQTVLYSEVEVPKQTAILHKSCDRKVAENTTESDRNQEQRLKPTYNTQIQQETAHADHNQVLPCKVCKTCIGQEICQ